tara:strand:- start:310 stop:717 length:408 start_codon:yes stop_codon:yes gene_type:complete
MKSQIRIEYLGGLRTQATHLQSKKKIITDAPIDNHGRGEAFSPTDLLATSLASCILTIIAITLEKSNIFLQDIKAEVLKEMYPEPRKLKKISINITIVVPIEKKYKIIIERAAKSCPVHKSLAPELEKEINFIYN